MELAEPHAGFLATYPADSMVFPWHLQGAAVETNTSGVPSLYGGDITSALKAGMRPALDFGRGMMDGANPVPFWPQAGPMNGHDAAYQGGVMFGAGLGLLVDILIFAASAPPTAGGVVACGTGVGCIAGGPAASAGAAGIGLSAISAGHHIGKGLNAGSELGSIVRHQWLDWGGYVPFWRGGRKFTKTGDIDSAADELAKRLGGMSNVKISGFGNREFDAVSQKYIAQTFGGKSGATPTFVTKAKNFMSKSRRTQIRETIRAAIETGRTPLFEFVGGQPHDDVLNFIRRNADRQGVTPRIIVRE